MKARLCLSPDSRRTLSLFLGASFVIFLGLFFWRLAVNRQYEAERRTVEAELRSRQTSLEARLADLANANQDDYAALQERIRRVAALQKPAPVVSGETVSQPPFRLEDVMPAIVELVCIDNVDEDIYYTASGTVVDRTGLILTNQHNLKSDDGTLIRACGVGFTVDTRQPPEIEYVAIPAALHKTTDLAILQITERLDGRPLPAIFPAISLKDAATSAIALSLGDAIFIGGYPAAGADTFTFTSGVVSGRLGTEFIKTSALVDTGTSGGAAFDEGGHYVGVPTAAARGEIGGSVGYLIGAEIVDKFLIDFYAGREGASDKTN